MFLNGAKGETVRSVWYRLGWAGVLSFLFPVLFSFAFSSLPSFSPILLLFNRTSILSSPLDSSPHHDAFYSTTAIAMLTSVPYSRFYLQSACHGVYWLFRRAGPHCRAAD